MREGSTLRELIRKTRECFHAASYKYIYAHGIIHVDVVSKLAHGLIHDKCRDRIIESQLWPIPGAKACTVVL